jgi:hypothetical protein
LTDDWRGPDRGVLARNPTAPAWCARPARIG